MKIEDPSRTQKSTRHIDERIGIQEDRWLTGSARNIAEALALPGAEEIEFDPPRALISTRPADFS